MLHSIWYIWTLCAQVFPQASTMMDKLQESLQFYKEMSKTEEQSSPQKTRDSEKKDLAKEDSNKGDHLTQVATYAC